MGARRTLRRWHVRLGWIVGLPILFWTLSGVVMVLKPIEEVRGEALLAKPSPVRMAQTPVPPALGGVRFSSLSLESRAEGPRWIIALPDGTTRRADPGSGLLLPPLSAADAAREVAARYAGTAKVAAVSRTDPAKPPIDLRRPIPTWRVAYDDGTYFYVDARSGAIVATRTRWWRFYDWMWGLHIMDLGEREDTSNAWMRIFGIAALAMSLLALVLLPLTLKRKGNGSA